MVHSELMRRLDELSWGEQIDFELSERDATATDVSAEPSASDLQELAATLTKVDLDQLAQEPGYLAWTLRLSPLVRGDNCTRRAESALSDSDSDSEVRFWAQRALDFGR